ncbi:MAG: hypothetical protein Q8M03_14220 [Legionella sp.]|nr:hypothetical protein [Legionella sp.]
MRQYLSKLRQRLKAEAERPILSFYSSSEAQLYLADMAKDGLDTFTPYKTARHRRRDLLQGFYGLKNTMVGVFFVCFASWVFVANLCFRTVPSLFRQGFRPFLSKIKNDFYGLGIDLFGAFTQTLRGVTQIATWPLSILRSSWRSLLSGKWQNFQDRKSVVSLVKKADSVMQLNSPGSVGSMRNIIDSLAKKVLDNEEKKQVSTRGKIPTRSFYGAPISGITYLKMNKLGDMLSESEIDRINSYVNYFRQ